MCVLHYSALESLLDVEYRSEKELPLNYYLSV